MAAETLQFQAETKRLLDLVVNSIYTNKEIFLRELISNASDALDKLRIESLTNQDLVSEDYEPEIFVRTNQENNTVTVSDNGIGMTRDEVIANLGTIAKSGTKDFLEKISGTDGTAAQEMIGQFGVGFYSSFIVAEKVEVITRKADTDQAVIWTSEGLGDYTVDNCDKDSYGTTVTLYLKPVFCEGETNFLEISKLEQLVKKYSDFVRYPVKMEFSVERPIQKEESAEEDQDKETEEKEPETETVLEVRTVNSQKPLWSRNKDEITKEEYNDFYKQQFHDWMDPMSVIHVKAEGTTEYTALLYIPAKAPHNLYMPEYETGLQLFAKHVMVMDKCKDLLPDWLRCVKGLVDSPDLPLNISREILQQSTEVKTIGRSLEKNIYKQLSKMLKEDREQYEEFWTQFNQTIKFGIYGNPYNTKLVENLKDLLMFESSKVDKLTTLSEYIERMPVSQEKIFYVTGRDSQTIKQLPQMELLKERDIEVLYLFDPIDEFILEQMRQYAGSDFQSIKREDFSLDDEESQKEKTEIEELAKENEELLKDFKEVIGSELSSVRLTASLKNGAVCLVSGNNAPSMAMEQMFKVMNMPHNKAIQILEINPKHPVFEALKQAHSEGKDSKKFQDICTILYGLALFSDGYRPFNPSDFINRVTDLLIK